MTQSSVEPDTSSTGLDNTTYNLISALEREADFLYSTVGTYINDARKENRPQVEEIWKTMKEDKRKHIRMLREALSKEATENKMTR
jgi:rubrerythrin